MNTFHLDIITPSSTHTFENISYLRIPGLDGLVGIEANHANAIIALDIGEIKINIDGKTLYFASARPGGYGKIDIYYSNRNEDGSWSKAENSHCKSFI